MAKKEKMAISLQTLPNGYALTIDGEELMYFNEIDLLSGFLAHVGLGDAHPMEKGTILSSLFAAMMGSAYTDAVTTLKQRVALLTTQYNTNIDRMDSAIEYVNQSEKQIEGYKNRIKALEESIKSVDEIYASNKRGVTETNNRLTLIMTKVSELEKRSDKIFDKLTDILSAQQTIEDAKKKTSKDKSPDEGSEPSKSEKAADDGKKTRKSRKERDLEILEKAKGNKDIK